MVRGLQVLRMRVVVLATAGALAGLAAHGQDVAPAQAALAASSPAGLAQRVQITGHRADDAQTERLRGEPLRRAGVATGDAARLLQEIAGVSLYGAGGVSSLPAIRGLADDRLRTQVDGMDLVAACPNHMNPALSYIDPANVGKVVVHAGIAPVSAGGDSIGGSIQMDSAAPRFAAGGETLWQARLGAFARSSGFARGGNASGTWASERLSLGAEWSVNRQDNWRAARAFKPAAPGIEGGAPIAGDVVGSTAYQARNQALSVAWRTGEHLLQWRAGEQRLGFEGFPNQRMDMTANTSRQLNLRYSGNFGWGELQARLYRQDVDHAMDMGPDRYHYGYGMPMLTEAHTRGASLQAVVDCGGGDQLRLGIERQTYVLYDWWPPVGGVMGPNAFWNIDFGRRHRSGAYAEWDGRLAAAWSLRAGLRHDQVMTDTAPVQGYDNGLGALWGNEAAAFNAQPHRRDTRHQDGAAQLRWQPADDTQLELGWAQQTRSPNLYQRYPWSTQAMAALMNNFVGDGNGYIGNPDLRPEVARSWALTGQWQDPGQQRWQLKATLHRTAVRDFIDAQRCRFGQCSAANATARSGFVLLQYVNQPALLQGWDLSAQWRLARSEDDDGTAVRDWGLGLLASQVRGRNRATGDGLYNIMPAHLRLQLHHLQGTAEAQWQATLEWQLVAAKTALSQVRNEMATAGHGLLNLRGSLSRGAWRLDLGVDNLLNRFHTPPLSGAYVGQGPSMTTSGIAWGTPVPGPGRSLSASLQWRH